MYCDFFGLSGLPFNNTPDPKFFFNTPDHEEALASLIYTATQRKGYALVTGEVGSGKTLLTRLLLSRLPVGAQTAVITNSRLSGVELLAAICREFQVPVEPGASAADLCHALEEFLLQQYARDRLAIVVLDEAQNLAIDAFEELRLLGNLEAEDAKLLQVLILGQPELRDTMQRNELRQLRQRVFRTYHLKGLTPEQTTGYILHRLGVVGASRNDLFTPAALTAIYQASGGMPRLINQICDHALLDAYSAQSKSVTPAIVATCLDALDVGRELPPTSGRSTAATTRANTTEEVESVIGKLSERLAHFEQRIDSVAGKLRSPSEQSDAVRADLTQIRGIRQQAQTLFEDARAQMDVLQTRMKKLAVEGQASVAQLRDQAAGVAAATATHSRTVAERAARLHGEVVALSEPDREGIYELRDECDASRRTTMERIDAASEAETSRSARLELSLGGVLSQSRSDIETVRGQMVQLGEQHAARVERVLGGLETLVASVTAQCRTAVEQTARQVTESQARAELTQREIEAARRRSLADAESARGKLSEMIEAAGREAGQSQQQVEELIRQFDLRARSGVRRMEELAAAPTQAARESAEGLQQAVAAATSQAARARKELETISRAAEQRLASSTASLQKSLTVHRAEFDTLRTSAVGLHSDLAAKLAACRADAERQIREQMRATTEMRKETSLGVSALRAEAAECARRMAEEADGLRARAEEASRAALIEQEARLDAAARKAGSAQERIAQSLAALEQQSDGIRERIDAATKQSQTRMAAVNDLAKTALDDLTAKADAARTAWRADLANGEARMTALLEAARRESMTMADEFKSLRTEVAAELSEAVARIQSERENAHEAAARMVTTLSRLTDRATESTEAAEERVAKIVAESEAGVQRLSVFADEMAQRVAATLAEAQEKVGASRAQHEQDAERLRGELSGMIEANRERIAELEQRADELEPRARQIGDEIEQRMRVAQESAARDVENFAGDFARMLGETQSSAGQMRRELEAVQQGLVAAAETAKREAEDAIARRQATVERLRQISSEAIVELREEADRATQQAASLRLDLQTSSDDVRRSVEAAENQLRQTTTSLASQIESIRDAARQDAEATAGRLAGLREQVESGAEQVRQQSARLLSQGESASASLRMHADELMEAAQRGAERVADEAKALLAGADASVARFDERAAEAVREITTQAEAVKGEVAKLRGELHEGQERFEEAAVLATRESVRSKEQAETLLGRATEVEGRTTELRDMTRSVAAVVKTLATAQTHARKQTEQITHANAAADERLAQISQHTARVGQLVGIIRQLYGALDTRIDSLRERLNAADDICRSVPREIETLREALHSPSKKSVRGLPAGTRRAAAPANATGDKAAGGNKNATLGDVIRRNQKLNEWLEKTVAASGS